jgi:hypothetical protein
MKKQLRQSILLISIIITMIYGCAQISTPDNLKETPSLSPAVTATPIPTKTLVPTKTPIPPTPTLPAPDKSKEYLNGVQVVKFDNFDDPSGAGWGFDAGKIKNGNLEVIGKNWNGLIREGDFKDGQGVIVDFQFSKGSVFEMMLDNGDWWTDPYKRFGIYLEHNIASANIWSGKNGLGGARLSGNFTPKPDTTYSLLLAPVPEGGFIGVIWNPSDPSQTILYREKIGKNWSKLPWVFKIGADKGTILFDNFREIIYDSVK